MFLKRINSPLRYLYDAQVGIMGDFTWICRTDAAPLLGNAICMILSITLQVIVW